MNVIKMVLLFIFVTLVTVQAANADSQDSFNEQRPISVSLSILNSGPVLPGASEVFFINVKAEDKTIIEQLQNTPEWWKYVKIFCQINSPDSLKGSIFIPQLNNVRDATKSWRFIAALENPIDKAPLINQEPILKKKLVADPISSTPFSGAIYSFLAILDTREAAKVNKSIPSLYVPQIGASIFQIQDKSALQIPHNNQTYIEDQFTAELLQGDFDKAEQWIQKYIEAGGDPVVAANFKVKVLLYQRKFSEAYKQYKKMAEMDAQYRKAHPNVEPYVLPGMVAEFKAKIDAAIQKEKSAPNVEKSIFH